MKNRTKYWGKIAIVTTRKFKYTTQTIVKYIESASTETTHVWARHRGKKGRYTTYWYPVAYFVVSDASRAPVAGLLKYSLAHSLTDGSANRQQAIALGAESIWVDCLKEGLHALHARLWNR